MAFRRHCASMCVVDLGNLDGAPSCQKAEGTSLGLLHLGRSGRIQTESHQSGTGTVPIDLSGSPSTNVLHQGVQQKLPW